MKVPLQGASGDLAYLEELGERLAERVQAAAVGVFDGDLIGEDLGVIYLYGRTPTASGRRSGRAPRRFASRRDVRRQAAQPARRAGNAPLRSQKAGMVHARVKPVSDCHKDRSVGPPGRRGSGLSAVKPAVEKLVGEDRDVPSNPAPCGHARRLATHASAFSTDRSRPPKPKLNANWRRAVAAPTGGAQRPGYAPAASRPGTTHYDCSTGGPTRCPSSGRRRRTGRTSVG